jgi:uncharacterized protein (DUF1697 family)
MSTHIGAAGSYVSLLRGINVGGHNKIKMRELEDDEWCVLTSDVAYLSCTYGLGRSKMANGFAASPQADVKPAMQNWRTLNKILERLG